MQAGRLRSSRRRGALPAHSKLDLKFKIPSPLLPREATGWRRDHFRKSGNSHCDLNTFSRAFKSCCNVRAGLLTFGFALKQRSHSQWRDRAGFSPASLFSPLLCGAPERMLKNRGTIVPFECAHLIMLLLRSQKAGHACRANLKSWA